MVKNKDRWSALSMTERADLIKLYVDSGITSLDIIKKDYNSFAPGGPIETDEYGYPADITPAVVEADYPRENEVWKRADASTADIIQRLKQGSSRATIPDHKNPRMVATHKMMSAGNYVVGNVQNINGQLFDFTDPKHGFKNSDRAAIDSAIKRGDYVEFDTEGDARYFAEHYKKYYNGFGDGGPTNEGGWPEDTLKQRRRRYGRYDPVGGLGADQLLYMFFGGNHSSGEENEYWKAYLGLDNNVPKMSPNAKTSWDDAVEKQKIESGELPSDFYGTTPRMDLTIQAVADTLNTGKILRNYDDYKKKHKDLPSKKTVERIYNTGKRILENPNTWQQVDGDNNAIKKKLDIVTNESNPLGMLANFGMMWNPEEKALYMHDTYDFPDWATSFVGDRPKEMKIRSKIGFDPKKGSVLLRDELKQFNKY